MGPGIGPNLNISRDPEAADTTALEPEEGATSGTTTGEDAVGVGDGLPFCLQATKPAPLSRPTCVYVTASKSVLDLLRREESKQERKKEANTKGG